MPVCSTREQIKQRGCCTAITLHVSHVESNGLTWLLRNAAVKCFVDVDKNNNFQYRLFDQLDLSPQEGRQEAYNNILTVLAIILLVREIEICKHEQHGNQKGSVMCYNNSTHDVMR